jgi:hypothetical protein
VRQSATADLRAPVSKDAVDHNAAQLVFGGTLAKIGDEFAKRYE